MITENVAGTEESMNANMPVAQGMSSEWEEMPLGSLEASQSQDLQHFITLDFNCIKSHLYICME